MPIDISGYKPQNADGGYKGNIPIRKSLALSRNIPAIKAMQISGVEPTLKLSEQWVTKCTVLKVMKKMPDYLQQLVVAVRA